MWLDGALSHQTETLKSGICWEPKTALPGQPGRPQHLSTSLFRPGIAELLFYFLHLWRTNPVLPWAPWWFFGEDRTMARIMHNNLWYRHALQKNPSSTPSLRAWKMSCNYYRAQIFFLLSWQLLANNRLVYFTVCHYQLKWVIFRLELPKPGSDRDLRHPPGLSSNKRPL